MLVYSDQPLLKCLEVQAETTYRLVFHFYKVMTDRLGLYSSVKLLTSFAQYSILSSEQNFGWTQACT
jgi:hypothetical protein